MRQWRRGVSVVLACRDQFRIPCKRVGAACYTTDMEAIRNPVFRGRVVRRTFPATPDNGKNVTLATEADGRVLVVSFDTRAEVSRTKTDNFLIAMLKGRLGVSQLSLSLWAFSPLPTEERPLHRMAEVREPSYAFLNGLTAEDNNLTGSVEGSTVSLRVTDTNSLLHDVGNKVATTGGFVEVGSSGIALSFSVTRAKVERPMPIGEQVTRAVAARNGELAEITDNGRSVLMI
eukprot:Hpha_TRINITY_DN12446_c0_g2::TRINITY_DN12446_c0_g2_i2::g.42799::m.42799